MRKKSTAFYLIPLILLLTIVPLIVHVCTIHTNLSQFDWYTTIDDVNDFFLYYKSVAITWIAAVMCALLAWRYAAKKKEFKLCYEMIPVLVYAVLTLLSSLFSEYRYFSFHGAQEMFETVWVLLGYCVIAFYAYQFVNTIEDVDCIMMWLTVGLGVMLIVGVMQAVGHDLFETPLGHLWVMGLDKDRELGLVFEKGRVFLTVYNPNYVASYFALMIPVEIAMLVKTRKWIYRIIYAAFLVASLVCLLASGNRSGIVAFAVTAVLTIVLLYKRILKAWKIVVPSIAVAAVIVVAFISRNDFILEKFIRLFSAPDLAQDAVSEIVTGDEDVAVTYLGNVFRVSYEVYDDGYVLHMVDDDGQELSNTLDEQNYLYSITDERFLGVTVQVVNLNEQVALAVNVDSRDWYFQKGEDGTYYYYNVFGKWDKINNAPRVAADFLEKKFEERGTIWSKTIPMLKNCILFGTGADTYTVTYPQDDYVDKVYDGTTTAIDVKPHCFYLQVATQSGIPALIAILVFYIWYFITSFKLYRTAAYENGLEIIGTGLLLATFTYMVISFLNDSTVSVAPIYWIMMGMGIAVNEIVKKQRAQEEALAAKNAGNKSGVDNKSAGRPDVNAQSALNDTAAGQEDVKSGGQSAKAASSNVKKGKKGQKR